MKKIFRRLVFQLLTGLLLIIFLNSCNSSSGFQGDGAGSLSMTSPNFQSIIKRAKDRVFPALIFMKVLKEEYREGKKKSREVSGSGVIISPSGEILSNWHVVNKATEIRCLLYNGQAYSARIVGEDKDADLALLQLNLPKGAKALPFAGISNSKELTEGDFVMAMGAPWGLSRSISVGIVSCSRRYLMHTSEYSLWIQTDAAISPGNSGGPLINIDGKVVGINTRAVMRGGDMGFASASETIIQVLPRLRKYGRANWSWTGLRLPPLKDFSRNIYFDQLDNLKMKNNKNVYIIAGPNGSGKSTLLRTATKIISSFKGEISIDGKSLTSISLEDMARSIAVDRKSVV